MALLSPITLSAGTAATMTMVAASAGGDTVSYNPSKQQVLIVKNDHTANQTPTITARRTSIQYGQDNYTRANIASAVAANGGYRAIPLTEAFVDDSGIITITYSAVVALSVALLEV